MMATAALIGVVLGRHRTRDQLPCRYLGIGDDVRGADRPVLSGADRTFHPRPHSPHLPSCGNRERHQNDQGSTSATSNSGIASTPSTHGWRVVRNVCRVTCTTPRNGCSSRSALRQLSTISWRRSITSASTTSLASSSPTSTSTMQAAPGRSPAATRTPGSASTPKVPATSSIPPGCGIRPCECSASGWLTETWGPMEPVAADRVDVLEEGDRIPLGQRPPPRCDVHARATPNTTSSSSTPRTAACTWAIRSASATRTATRCSRSRRRPTSIPTWSPRACTAWRPATRQFIGFAHFGPNRNAAAGPRRSRAGPVGMGADRGVPGRRR